MRRRTRDFRLRRSCRYSRAEIASGNYALSPYSADACGKCFPIGARAPLTQRTPAANSARSPRSLGLVGSVSRERSAGGGRPPSLPLPPAGRLAGVFCSNGLSESRQHMMFACVIAVAKAVSLNFVQPTVGVAGGQLTRRERNSRRRQGAGARSATSAAINTSALPKGQRTKIVRYWRAAAARRNLNTWRALTC